MKFVEMRVIFGRFFCLVLVLSSCFWSLPVFAGQLRLIGNQHWLTVASSKDIDTAVAIARYYSGAKAKVVSSQSGWFAVVMGPYAGHSVKEVLSRNTDIGDVPSDTRLSRGENYLDVVWEKQPYLAELQEYAPGKPAKLESGTVSFFVSMTGDEDNPGPSFVRGEIDGRIAFNSQTSNEYSILGAGAGVFKLDPNSANSQLVYTRYSGGAHCCTHTWIASKPRQATEWTIIDTGMLDSDGYRLEDLDGDSALELLSVDNRFLYAFDSYAASFAPLQIQQVRGGKLIDVSKSLAFQSALRQDLASIEFAAKLDPSLWRSNGFLVGWAASKIRLGQGEEAWATVAKNLDEGSDFGPQRCKLNIPLDECPAEELVKIPVAQALAMFLSELGYGPLPQAAADLLL